MAGCKTEGRLSRIRVNNLAANPSRASPAIAIIKRSKALRSQSKLRYVVDVELMFPHLGECAQGLPPQACRSSSTHYLGYSPKKCKENQARRWPHLQSKLCGVSDNICNLSVPTHMAHYGTVSAISCLPEGLVLSVFPADLKQAAGAAAANKISQIMA